MRSMEIRVVEVTPEARAKAQRRVMDEARARMKLTARQRHLLQQLHPEAVIPGDGQPSMDGPERGDV